ncbi:COX15/CtaA family protein [Alicyclobacillus sp. ALC3]|uniref:COX15/CtaA family protein n=1 Tax=Alicyclobacillus sp. ALC3 TaxID=2796143 RepID=UPI0023793FDD|nr:COX15/CtaA family protein [Alicyclobacillus sp. ALC3]WDL95495.1 COX15/CtaA family protein [Alicyclobacillus sp. ALC3]
MIKLSSTWYRVTLILSILTLIGLFAVNIVGFVDTETGSALGCGHDWPLCNGAVIPHAWGIKTLIEFTHRALVGVVTVLLLGTSGLAWRLYRYWPEVKATIAIAVGFVFVQAGLGALGVIYGDPAWFLAFHFGCSLLAFVGVLLLVVVLLQIGRSLRDNNARDEAGAIRLRQPVRKGPFTRAVWFTLVYMYVAMYYGAFVSSTGDGSGFRGWPLPTEVHSGSVFLVDIVHRAVALGLAGLIVYLWVQASRMRKEHPDLYVGSWLTLVFVILVALSGATLIWTNHTALWAFLLHVSMVTGLFGSLSYLGLQIIPSSSVRIPQSLKRLEEISL